MVELEIKEPFLPKKASPKKTELEIKIGAQITSYLHYLAKDRTYATLNVEKKKPWVSVDSLNPIFQELIDILAQPNMGDEGRKAKLVAIKAWQIKVTKLLEPKEELSKREETK